MKKVHNKMAWSACKLLEVMVLTLLLGLMLCSQVGSQFTQPGHKYKVDVYLPDGCGEASYEGMYGVNLLSQREDTYGKHLDCTIHLRVPKGFVFNITFARFELEPPAADGTCADYLQLYNGLGTELKLSAPLCGKHIPRPMISNTSVVTLLFHTDGQSEHTGFSLMYDRINANVLRDNGQKPTIQQEFVEDSRRSENIYSEQSSTVHGARNGEKSQKRGAH